MVRPSALRAATAGSRRFRPPAHPRAVLDPLPGSCVLGAASQWTAGGSVAGPSLLVQAAGRGSDGGFIAGLLPRCCAPGEPWHGGVLLSSGSCAQVGSARTGASRYARVLVLLVQSLGFSLRGLGILCERRALRVRRNLTAFVVPESDGSPNRPESDHGRRVLSSSRSRHAGVPGWSYRELSVSGSHF